MPQEHPYRTYENTNIRTADQLQLIVMLYDGMLRYLRKAVAKIETHDVEGAHNYLVRSRQVVAELLATLRPEKGGEIGDNLRRLYVYAFNRLVEANLLKDAERVQEVIRIMETLRDGWNQIRPAQAKRTVSAENIARVNVRG
jgi:flagellar protein FliS